jgi:LacI family transcriptional regulator
MNKKTSTPTMKDVAREAGVSLGTVSNVFNGAQVSESYKIKVEEAARKLGYKVNRYARGLKTNQTRTIAFICPGTDHPFFADMANYISKALQEQGYRMMLAVTQYSLDMEQKCIQMVTENKVDGIIALTYNPDLIIDENLPFVSIDRFYSESVPCISCDNYAGGTLAARKLCELGATKLLFFNIAPAVSGEPDKRQAGFESWCRFHNVPFESIVSSDDQAFRPFLNLVRDRIHDGKPDFDGIFCNTDKLAYVICQILKENGISVPEDVQVIGFDGINMFGDNMMPCVSSIVQPVEQMALQAVSMLLSADRTHLPTLTCLPVRYRPGGTTREDFVKEYIYGNGEKEPN